MAYDKIIPIKGRLDHCMNYVLNPQKTDLGLVLDYIENTDKTITPDGRTVLETAINCQLGTAYQEMQATKRRWHKNSGVLGYHLIHSYAPGEVTPEKAHALGIEFARNLLGDRYEVVISTHVDHAHLHNHILFNSVSFLDGKKYRDNFKAYFGDIRSASNEISRKHGLSVIEPSESGKSYAQWDAEKSGKQTVRGLIRQDIDTALCSAFTYQSFFTQLEKMGYTVKRGPNVKYTAVRPPGGSRFIRLDSLGEGYTEAELKARLSASRYEAPRKETSTPKRYHIHKPLPKQHRKPHGFQALYVYYLYFLGIRKPSPKRKPAPFPVRKEVTRLKRYTKQFRLLHRYQIETDTQLSMLTDALQAKIDCLTEERKGLYRRKRNGTDVDHLLQPLNSELRDLRAELRLCDQIVMDATRIRSQLSEMKTQPIIEKPHKRKEVKFHGR